MVDGLGEAIFLDADFADNAGNFAVVNRCGLGRIKGEVKS